MRNKVDGFITVRAISGTHVVFLAFDMKESDAKGLMGFAIHRTDLTEDETVWLRGNKTFAGIRPKAGIEEASSHEHPFQTFQWADYSAKPGYQYRYRIIPMYEKPGELKEKESTTIAINTEPLTGETHEIHFNRGAIASQAFVKRFPGMTLDKAGEPAYAWLTRDLMPAMLSFIARAKNRKCKLHAAIYELQWQEVLDAFKHAAGAGAEVIILYHAKDDDTGRANEQKIKDTGIRSLCKPRKYARLMHNKFIVLSEEGKPASVWTGSTNLSRNALFGQLNVGHVINDPDAAKDYLAYWNKLAKDPDQDDLKDWAETENPMPPANETRLNTPIFSPHHGRGVFEWWINMAKECKKPLFMTFPFGIVKDFRPVFDQNDGVLRFGLLDKFVNGGDKASRASAIAEIQRIRRFPNIGMALGGRIFVDSIDGWFMESAPIGVHANWVHTKFMLIDPLGSEPVTLTGSANWSEASVNDNDENMILIRGDKRVADIYFSEFMRIFAHHRFRESVARHLEKHGPKAFSTWKPQDLFEDWKKWVPKNYRSGSEYDIKRRYFAG